MKKLLRDSATFYITGNQLVIPGTNITQAGDIITDALLMIPKKTEHGLISWSFYQQAKRIYDKTKDKLMIKPKLIIKGHSLGGSVGLLVAYIMLQNGYTGKLHLRVAGAPKVISKDVAAYLSERVKSVMWRVNHRDIVPFLGWWSEPLHTTRREGRLRKHILDWSFKAHVKY